MANCSPSAAISKAEWSYFKKADRAQSRAQPSAAQSRCYPGETGANREAIAPLQQAVRLSPDSPEASYYLGSVFAAQNRYAEAADYFYQSLRIRPGLYPGPSKSGSTARIAGQERRGQAALSGSRPADETKPPSSA